MVFPILPMVILRGQRRSGTEVYEKRQKFKKKWPKNETFFNFFPTPQPPGTLGPSPRARARHGGVVGQSFIPIGPNGASFMPIFRFKFRHCFNHPKKTRLGTLGITWRRKGNLLFFIFYWFLPNDSTIISSFSFPPPGDLNVLESSNRTKGWPPFGECPV